MALEERVANVPAVTGSPIEVRIRSLSSDGAGVGDLPDGPVVFVHRTAPDDRVRVMVQTAKARWARARLREVIEPSPERVVPPCPHYHACGGCTLQHIPYDSQLQWKGRFVSDALTRIGGFEQTAPEVQPSPGQLGYRSRVTFTLLRIGGGRIVAGLHKLDAPARVHDIPDACLIADPRINVAWAAIRSSWGQGARNLPGGPALRLTLMAADEGVVLVVAGGKGKGDLARLLDPDSGLVAVWRVGGKGETQFVAGVETVHETRLDESVSVGPVAFSQVNPAMADNLHRSLLDAVPGPASCRIIDAYCGTGLLGRRFAREGATVVGIELDAAAVSAALVEAPAGFEVLHGAVEELLEQALPADLVILNPPRAGLAKAVPRLLSERPVETVAYVSCDPATLARDLERLAPAYEIEQVLAFDMFPQTAHVETLVILSSREHTG